MNHLRYSQRPRAMTFRVFGQFGDSHGPSFIFSAIRISTNLRYHQWCVQVQGSMVSKILEMFGMYNNFGIGTGKWGETGFTQERHGKTCFPLSAPATASTLALHCSARATAQPSASLLPQHQHLHHTTKDLSEPTCCFASSIDVIDVLQICCKDMSKVATRYTTY